jgi:hypothetical protein
MKQRKPILHISFFASFEDCPPKIEKYIQFIVLHHDPTESSNVTSSISNSTNNVAVALSNLRASLDQRGVNSREPGLKQIDHGRFQCSRSPSSCFLRGTAHFPQQTV